MKHTFKIIAGLLLLAGLTGALALYGPGPWQRFALALNNNYSTKAEGDQLTAAEWNFLDEDFVKKEGDTMTGALNMGGQRITGLPATPPTANTDAASKGYVDSAVAAGGGGTIRDTAGNNLKIICGRTTPGATAWVQGPNTWTIETTVDTSAAAFTNGTFPWYQANLGGLNEHYHTAGVTSVYQADYDSFRVFIRYFGSTMNPATANSTGYQWHINWCAFGR